MRGKGRLIHPTNKGLEYWYSKANGGLERITGIPFAKLGCDACHVRTCDTCHVLEVDGKPVYSLDRAKTETACKKCHEIEKPAEPLVNYSGFSAPITKEQFSRLAKPQSPKP